MTDRAEIRREFRRQVRKARRRRQIARLAIDVLEGAARCGFWRDRLAAAVVVLAAVGALPLMPRRNHTPRTRAFLARRRRDRIQRMTPPETPQTPHDMARDLVARGLAPLLILGPIGPGRRPGSEHTHPDATPNGRKNR